MRPEEIRVITDGEVTIPPRSYGLDSDRILEELMGSKPRNESVESLLRSLFGLIDGEDFEGARNLLPQVEAKLGPDDAELTRARTLMTFLESEASGPLLRVRNRRALFNIDVRSVRTTTTTLIRTR